MPFSYNPISGQFDLDSAGEFYSKAEVDALIQTLQNNINDKLTKNSVDGTFTTTDGKTITVLDGQITNIA